MIDILEIKLSTTNSQVIHKGIITEVEIMDMN